MLKKRLLCLKTFLSGETKHDTWVETYYLRLPYVPRLRDVFINNRLHIQDFTIKGLISWAEYDRSVK